MTRQRLALGLIIVTITQVLTSLSELSSATGVGALKLAASRGLVVTYFLLAAALITSIVRLDADVALATLAFVGLSEIKHAILPIEQKGSSAPHDEEAPSRLSRPFAPFAPLAPIRDFKKNLAPSRLRALAPFAPYNIFPAPLAPIHAQTISDLHLLPYTVIK